jgi:DNA-binding response OmpR family regulator
MNVCIVYKGDASFVWKYFAHADGVCAEMMSIDAYRVRVSETQFDIVIFDVVYAKGNECDVETIAEIRHVTSVPIFLIVGNNEDASYREMMFNAGIDGCIQVPFLKDELFARLKILIKKEKKPLFTGTVVHTHGVCMDIRTHHVVLKGKKLNLTKIEYSILFHLFLHKQSVVSVDELSLYIHSEVGDYPSVLNVHILNLRRKVGKLKIIRTVSQYGFMAR